MQSAPANPFTRADTLTGTCQAIGEDFGFHPNILRVAFALALFWSAGWTFAAYGALAGAVLASRLVFPGRRTAKAKDAAPVQAENDDAVVEMAKAA